MIHGPDCPYCKKPKPVTPEKLLGKPRTYCKTCSHESIGHVLTGVGPQRHCTYVLCKCAVIQP